MTEPFRDKDWVSLWSISMDIAQMLPPGVHVPQMTTLKDWADEGLIPAWRRPGGWLIRKHDIPAVAEAITTIRQRQQRYGK